MTDTPKPVANEPKETVVPEVKKPDVAGPAAAPIVLPDVAKK